MKIRGQANESYTRSKLFSIQSCERRCFLHVSRPLQSGHLFLKCIRDCALCRYYDTRPSVSSRTRLYISQTSTETELLRLLGYDPPNTPPEITSHPPPAFPRVGVHQAEIVPQPRISELSDVDQIGDPWVRGCGEGHSARLVEVQLIGRCECERWPLACCAGLVWQGVR